MITILFLAADPTDGSRLRLGEEVREIGDSLQRARRRDEFVLHQRFSVRPADISQALLDLDPHIVHFSGHGAAAGAIYVEDPMGKAKPIQPESLAALFEQFSDRVACVVLNTCYSEAQARAIARHIDHVVGMSREIGDEAAIAFSVGFYQGLGAGRAVKRAHKLGCAQIGLQGIPEHLTPVLHSKEARAVDMAPRPPERPEPDARRERVPIIRVEIYLDQLHAEGYISVDGPDFVDRVLLKQTRLGPRVKAIVDMTTETEPFTSAEATYGRFARWAKSLLGNNGMGVLVFACHAPSVQMVNELVRFGRGFLGGAQIVASVFDQVTGDFWLLRPGQGPYRTSKFP